MLTFNNSSGLNHRSGCRNCLKFKNSSGRNNSSGWKVSTLILISVSICARYKGHNSYKTDCLKTSQKYWYLAIVYRGFFHIAQL